MVTSIMQSVDYPQELGDRPSNGRYEGSQVELSARMPSGIVISVFRMILMYVVSHCQRLTWRVVRSVVGIVQARRQDTGESEIAEGEAFSVGE